MRLAIAALAGLVALGARDPDCPAKFVRCLNEHEAREVLLIVAERDRLTEEVRALRGGSWLQRHIGLGIGLGPVVPVCSRVGDASSCVGAAVGVIIKF